jgi:hypothetical protein
MQVLVQSDPFETWRGAVGIACRQQTKNESSKSALMRTIRRIFLALAWCVAFPIGVSAQVLTPDIERGLTWLQSQVRADRTVIGEEAALAERQQVRCEVKATLQAFNRTGAVLPCMTTDSTLTEILARTGAAIPAGYWLPDGGVAPDAGYAGSSVIDTSWALGTSGITMDQSLAAIAYLYGYQASSGGFAASGSGPETVAATGLIGRQLALRKGSLAGDQPARLAAAAAWVASQAQAPGRWSSLYETALAHLFLVLESPDAVRDAATYEHFIANQKANGSWLDDPFLTALVLRAAGTRSLPRTNESGFRLRVIDAVTRAPVQDAFVNGTSRTDSNGYVTVVASPTASLSISISKTGYQTRTLTTPIVTGVVADLGEVELQPLANAILVSGDVLNDTTLQPVFGATVQVWVNGAFVRVASTDVNGHYESSLTTAGRYRVVILSSGYITSAAEFDGALGNAYQVDVRLKPVAANADGTFRGTVTDASTGAPIGAATVSWRSISGATRSALTAADGTYVMSGLVREAGDLTFSRLSYAGRLVSGVTPSNPEAVVSAQLVAGTQAAGQLSGVARDSASGAPLAGARIEIVNRSTNVTVAVLTTDGAGQFSAAGLAFTTYRFTATLAGYASLAGEFVASSSVPFVQLNLSMLRAVGGITGKVVDKASGAAIAGATVRVGTSEVQSDPAGVFTVSGLDAGVHSVEVSAPGYRTSTFSASVVSGLVTDIGKVELVASAGTNVAEVFGTVKAKSGGAPIAGATVSIVGIEPAIAATSDASGAFGLRDVPLGTREIRVVAPGYQPATYTMALTEPIRYRLDATLTAADANEVTLGAVTDFPSYGAYAPGKVTTTFSVAAGVSQSGHLEFAVFDGADRLVKTLPEPGSSQSTQVLLTPNTPSFVMPFTTGNLAPGAYRVQVSLYDALAGAGNSSRALLALANASFTVAATRRIEAITVIPLPEYANVGVPTAAGYRVEITNRSNVAVDLDFDLRLQGPAGAVGLVTQRVAVRPDEVFKAVDISAGTIAFSPHGQYQAVAAVTGVDPPPIAARAISVLPAIRIEVQKKLLPAVVPPPSDQKIRVDIRLKGVGQ